MNKITKISVILFSAAVLLSSNAHAIPDPVKVVQTSFSDVQDALKNVQSTYEEVKVKVNKAVTSVKDAYKAASQKILDGLVQMSGSKEDKAKPLSAMKTIKDSKLLKGNKKKDPEAVKAVVQQLFMAYPSADGKIKEAYRKKAQEFLNDTLIEVYVTSRSFEEQIASLEQQLDELEKQEDAAAGEGEDADAGQLKAAVESYEAYDTFNDLTRIAETLNLLRTQYKTVKFINENIVPAPYEEKEGKSKKKSDATDYINLRKVHTQSYSYNNTFTLSFAYQEEEDKKPYGGYVYDVEKNSKVNFVSGRKKEIESAFAGTEKEFENLKTLDTANGYLIKAMTAHNIKQQLPTFRDNFLEYEKMVERHKMAVDQVVASDKCAINYLGNFYKDPARVWYGASKLSNPTNYASRKGISGWAYKAFQTAKALHGDDGFAESDLMSTDYVKSDDDNSPDLGKKMASAEKSMDNKYKSMPKEDEDDNDISSMNGIKDSKKRAEAKRNSRIKEKLNFIIGAEVAKSLAADQYSANPKWGTPYKRFPIWQDQRRFYTQYLNYKYQNMVDYVNSIDVLKYVLDLAKLKVSQDKWGKDDREKLNKLNADLGKVGEIIGAKGAEIIKASQAELLGAIDRRKAALDKVELERIRTLASYDDDIKKKEEKLDALYGEIEDIKQLIDQYEEEKDTATAKISHHEDEIEINNKRAEVSGEQNSTLRSFAVIQKDESQKSKDVAEEKLNTQQTKIKVLRSQAAAIEKEISEIKKSRAEKALQYEEIVAQEDERTAADVYAARGKISENASSLTKVYDEYVTDKKIKGLTERYLGEAEGVMAGCIKAYASNIIAKAGDEMNMLGDAKYMPKGNIYVAQVHKNMVNKLQNITLSDFKNVMSITEDAVGSSASGCNFIVANQAAFAILKKVYAEALLGKVCKDQSCLVPDDEYFVGVAPVERDFKSPKTMKEYLPPLREIVYFDNDEYSIIPKKRYIVPGNSLPLQIHMRTTRSAVLDNMDGMPDIWRSILDSHSFVERGYDLSGVVPGMIDSVFDYVHSGIYPCRVANTYTITKYNKDKSYVYEMDKVNKLQGYYVDLPMSDDTIKPNLTKEGYDIDFRYNVTKEKPHGYYGEIPECQDFRFISLPNNTVSFMNNYPKGVKIGNNRYIVESVTNEIPLDEYVISDQEKAANSYKRYEQCFEQNQKDKDGKEFACYPSELQQIYSYANIGKNSLFFNDSIYAGAVAMKEDKDEVDGKDEAYLRLQANRNQFGNFLAMAENEQTMQEGLDELEGELAQLRAKIVNLLRSAGIDVKDDLNLADDKQYEDVQKALKNIKNDNISKVYGNIPGNLSNKGVLKEKLDRIRRIYVALMRDNEETIVISENTDGNSADFSQKMIEESVNKQAVEKYKKEVEHITPETPYCAVYPLYEGETEDEMRANLVKVFGNSMP